MNYVHVFSPAMEALLTNHKARTKLSASTVRDWIRSSDTFFAGLQLDDTQLREGHLDLLLVERVGGFKNEMVIRKGRKGWWVQSFTNTPASEFDVEGVFVLVPLEMKRVVSEQTHALLGVKPSTLGFVLQGHYPSATMKDGMKVINANRAVLFPHV